VFNQPAGPRRAGRGRVRPCGRTRRLLAKQNGATEEELIEAITHLAFYTGWPKAMSAMTAAKNVFTQERTTPRRPSSCTGPATCGSTSATTQ
jgi:hypothetical protein